MSCGQVLCVGSQAICDQRAGTWAGGAGPSPPQWQHKRQHSRQSGGLGDTNTATYLSVVQRAQGRPPPLLAKSFRKLLHSWLPAATEIDSTSVGAPGHWLRFPLNALSAHAHRTGSLGRAGARMSRLSKVWSDFF